MKKLKFNFDTTFYESLNPRNQQESDQEELSTNTFNNNYQPNMQPIQTLGNNFPQQQFQQQFTPQKPYDEIVKDVSDSSKKSYKTPTYPTFTTFT